MKKPDSCKNCGIYSHNRGEGYCPSPSGTDLYGIKIVGEKPNLSESGKGKPFLANTASGSKLNQVFKLLNKSPQGFKFGNLLNCTPNKELLENMPYEFDGIEFCRQTHQYKWLKADGTNYIFALGKLPMRELTGFNGIKMDRQSINHIRGYPIKTKFGWVVATHNPAMVRKGKPQYTHYLKEDLAKLFFVREHGWILPEYDFRYHPPKDELKSFYYQTKSLPIDSPIYYDIETDDSADTEEDERQGLTSNLIKTVQFCIEKDKAILLNWSEDNMAFIKLMFMLPNFKVGFNSYNFDDPRIEDKGVNIAGVKIDLMWMFKHWNPGLERGLQMVASLFDYPEPWKHKSNSDEGFYGCSDANAYSYIYPKLKEKMEKEGIWD